MQNENWYFTFGSNHGILKNKYVKISGTLNSTREELWNIRKNKWAFQYSEEEFKGQPSKYGLKEVKIKDLEVVE